MNLNASNVSFSASACIYDFLCGSVRFAKFWFIVSRFLCANSGACGYHSCVDHTGKTSIAVAWSQYILLKTFSRRMKGGNIYINWLVHLKQNEYIARDSGSGFHGIDFLTCLFRWVKNKSNSGAPNVSHMKLSISEFSCHFVASSDFQEFLSARIFFYNASQVCNGYLILKKICKLKLWFLLFLSSVISNVVSTKSMMNPGKVSLSWC